MNRVPKKRALFLIVLALAATLSASYLLFPKTRSVLSPIYFKRFFTYPKANPVTSAHWYEPLETVKGGGGSSLIRLTRSDPLGMSVKAALQTLALETDTEALLVVRAGRPKQEAEILFEYEKQGSIRPITTDS